MVGRGYSMADLRSMTYRQLTTFARVSGERIKRESEAMGM